MESFQWSEQFETGLQQVDQQHRRLVEIINRYSEKLSENKLLVDDVEAVCAELFDYAKVHFRDEQALMSETGIDQRHLDKHIASHQRFLAEATSIHSNIDPAKPRSGGQLLSFLIHWLAYHILHVDQDMARQIKAIRTGVAPSDAYEAEERQADNATQPLVGALSGMFRLVSARNAELDLINKTLEAKVAARTRALSEANRRLEELSLTDSLTGLPNRRHAMRRFADLWEESLRARTPLVCIMIDADQFKAVNDNFGHEAGDRVLRELARTLQHSLRNDDVVCRLGGDEFLIICPDTDQEGGLYVAKQTLKTVSALRIPTGDSFWHGSISAGVAARNQTMKSPDELMKRADEALYQAKLDGKNCVRLATIKSVA